MSHQPNVPVTTAPSSDDYDSPLQTTARFSQTNSLDHVRILRPRVNLGDFFVGASRPSSIPREHHSHNNSHHPTTLSYSTHGIHQQQQQQQPTFLHFASPVPQSTTLPLPMPPIRVRVTTRPRLAQRTSPESPLVKGPPHTHLSQGSSPQPPQSPQVSHLPLPAVVLRAMSTQPGPRGNAVGQSPASPVVQRNSHRVPPSPPPNPSPLPQHYQQQRSQMAIIKSPTQLQGRSKSAHQARRAVMKNHFVAQNAISSPQPNQFLLSLAPNLVEPTSIPDRPDSSRNDNIFQDNSDGKGRGTRTKNPSKKYQGLFPYLDSSSLPRHMQLAHIHISPPDKPMGSINENQRALVSNEGNNTAVMPPPQRVTHTTKTRSDQVQTRPQRIPSGFDYDDNGYDDTEDPSGRKVVVKTEMYRTQSHDNNTGDEVYPQVDDIDEDSNNHSKNIAGGVYVITDDDDDDANNNRHHKGRDGLEQSEPFHHTTKQPSHYPSHLPLPPSHLHHHHHHHNHSAIIDDADQYSTMLQGSPLVIQDGDRAHADAEDYLGEVTQHRNRDMLTTEVAAAAVTHHTKTKTQSQTYPTSPQSASVSSSTSSSLTVKHCWNPLRFVGTPQSAGTNNQTLADTGSQLPHSHHAAIFNSPAASPAASPTSPESNDEYYYEDQNYQARQQKLSQNNKLNQQQQQKQQQQKHAVDDLSLHVQDMISTHSLSPHIEGGYFRRLHGGDYDPMERSPMSSIYYLLQRDDFSAFHLLEDSTEIFILMDGQGLLIHKIHQDGRYTCEELSPSTTLQVTITPQTWFAAECLDKEGFGFVSCICSPAFLFQRFKMGEKVFLSHRFPQHSAIIERLCRE